MRGGNKQPSIDDSEHLSQLDGENIDAKKVAGYVWNPSGIDPTSGLPTGAWQRSGLASVSKFDVSVPPVYYVGEAPVGTDASSVGWKIQKFDLTDLANIDGSIATDVSWDDRAIGVYS